MPESHAVVGRRFLLIGKPPSGAVGLVVTGLVVVVLAGLVVAGLVVVAVAGLVVHPRRDDVARALPAASGRERVSAHGERQDGRAHYDRHPLHPIHLLVTSGSP